MRVYPISRYYPGHTQRTLLISLIGMLFFLFYFQSAHSSAQKDSTLTHFSEQLDSLLYQLSSSSELRTEGMAQWLLRQSVDDRNVLLELLRQKMKERAGQGQYKAAYQLALTLDRLGQNTEKEKSDLQDELARARFSRTVMEDNLRTIAMRINTPKNTGLSRWMYFLAINLLGLGWIIYLLIAKRSGLSAKKKSGPPLKTFPVQNGNSKPVNKLTERELDVLELVALNKSNPQIAKELFISTNTAKTHVASILTKLEVSDRQQATEKARELNLLKSRKTKPSSISISCWTGLIMFFFVSNITRAQETLPVKLENKSSCTYLVKINIIDDNGCRLNGHGPLVMLLPHHTIILPKLPGKTSIAAYGIEEVHDYIDVARIIGDPACNFVNSVVNTGRCKVVMKYSRQNLLIEPQKN